MTSKEKLTIDQLEYYRNTYERYDGIESNIFEQICNELIDFKKSKTYTLSECIKEWEDRGYEVWHHNKENVIEFDKYDKSNGHLFFLGKIELDLDDKEYWSDLCFNLEECQLLTKTLKALEEMKDLVK